MESSFICELFFEKETAAMLFIGLSLIAAAAFTGWLIFKNLTIIGNISQCYLQINDTYISGFTVPNLEIRGSGSYFEIAYRDISNVRAASGTENNNHYSLMIDYRGGTYKLSVSNAYFAMKEIMEHMNMYKADNYEHEI